MAEQFEFEGKMMTVAQVREHVPALSAEAIRNHLRKGRNTREAMLTYYPKTPKPSKQSQFVIGRSISKARRGSMR